jgi:hypothetical protein
LTRPGNRLRPGSDHAAHSVRPAKSSAPDAYRNVNGRNRGDENQKPLKGVRAGGASLVGSFSRRERGAPIWTNRRAQESGASFLLVEDGRDGGFRERAFQQVAGVEGHGGPSAYRGRLAAAAQWREGVEFSAILGQATAAWSIRGSYPSSSSRAGRDSAQLVAVQPLSMHP